MSQNNTQKKPIDKKDPSTWPMDKILREMEIMLMSFPTPVLNKIGELVARERDKRGLD